MNHPAVSIIIPAFNAEEHIESCINSCLTQTIDQNFEIIICDDASTDTTVDIINFLYNDYENIIILKNEFNIGVGGTRNKAIKMRKEDISFSWTQMIIFTQIHLIYSQHF